MDLLCFDDWIDVFVAPAFVVSSLDAWPTEALRWPRVYLYPYRVPAHYIYPQAFVQPSVVIPHVQPSAASATAAAATSPYLDYTGAAYAQYSAAATAAAAAAAYEQYPYAASPAPTSYMTTAGYGYTVQQPLATAATPGAAAAAAAFSQYQPQQLQTDRMQ